jgi:hypothetical protein
LLVSIYTYTYSGTGKITTILPVISILRSQQGVTGPFAGTDLQERGSLHWERHRNKERHEGNGGQNL